MSSKPQSNVSKGSPDGNPNSPNSSPNNSSNTSSSNTSKGGSKGDTKGEDAPQRQALPFEPTKSRKSAEKPLKSSPAPKAVKAEVVPRSAAKSTAASTKRSTTQEAAIPDAVSQRMIRRMAILCGVPTALGMSTFIVSYLLRVNHLFEVPTYAVLLVSLGWFGLGVLGLSYGLLSASWDEALPGSRVGWSEFKTNWGRMTGAWRSSKEES